MYSMSTLWQLCLLVTFQISSINVMGIFSSSYWKMDRFPFFEDPNSIHYIKQSRLLVFIPGDDDLCKKFREVYPSAKIFQGPPPSDEDGEDESFVSKVKEWMEKVPNDSSEMAVINHEKLATVEELQPFSQLGVKYQFVELYPYKSDREPLIPLFYGWFFNLRDSGDTLRRRADDLLRKVSKQDRFNKEFSKFAMDWDSKSKFLTFFMHVCLHTYMLGWVWVGGGGSKACSQPMCEGPKPAL